MDPFLWTGRCGPLCLCRAPEFLVGTRVSVRRAVERLEL